MHDRKEMDGSFVTTERLSQICLKMSENDVKSVS